MRDPRFHFSVFLSLPLPSSFILGNPSVQDHNHKTPKMTTSTKSSSRGAGLVTQLREQLGVTEKTIMGRRFGIALRHFRSDYDTPNMRGIYAHDGESKEHMEVVERMASDFLESMGNGERFWPTVEGNTESLQYSNPEDKKTYVRRQGSFMQYKQLMSRISERMLTGMQNYTHAGASDPPPEQVALP
jgi:hypothetical protein